MVTYKKLVSGTNTRVEIYQDGVFKEATANALSTEFSTSIPEDITTDEFREIVRIHGWGKAPQPHGRPTRIIVLHPEEKY